MISQAIYSAKRRWGKKLIFRVPTLTTVDYTTGSRVKEYEEFTIRRAAVLPESISSASNPMVFGYLLQGKGDNTQIYRFVLVDGRDIRGMNPKLRYVTELEGRQWVIDKITATIENDGYVIYLLATDSEA